jgi:hypothetical protein
MTDLHAVVPIRTVCHGCRAVSYEPIGDDDQRHRPVVVPGDGQVMREVMPGMMAGEPCPICGESDDPGWMPGFVLPV